jgi:endonuclease/exonuclease/phosphatase family metal-dependent hydrolase
VSIRVGSLNINKRLSGDRCSTAVSTWTSMNEIDFLLVQEPTKPHAKLPDVLDSLYAVGGNAQVYAWCRQSTQVQSLPTGCPFWQVLACGQILFHNVYLNAYKPAIRAEQLREIARGILALPSRSHVLMGDFNLAPEPMDGLFGGKPSHFNTRTDRVPFFDLLKTVGLVDIRSDEPDRQYTIERYQREKLSLFRCDLALVTQDLAPRITLRYDHNVRRGDQALTDHSALILSLAEGSTGA